MSRSRVTSAFLIPALAGMLLLGGCSSSIIESKKIDYKSAGKLPPLEIPPDLTAPGRDDRYAVPDTGTRGSATFSAYSGERAANRESSSREVLPQIEKMRIERSGTQRWLVVGMPPDKVWPSVKEFWQEIGFLVNVENPSAGVMETDWAENRAKLPQDMIRSAIGKVFDQLYSTAERDKFRTRLEAGAESGTTEIYISHRGMYEVYVTETRDKTRWQPRPPEPELEAEMLRRLMIRLGAEDSRAQSMLAAEPKAERAKLARANDGTGTLELHEPFDRAWRRVGLALDRVGFTVEDRDRSQGLYFVRYVDPESESTKKGEEKGFLSKLAFWRSDKPEAVQQANYRIHVASGGEGSRVRVLTREGGVDTSDSSRKILGLLFDQLK
ncbi:MAG TPA: outer membrane protein assembly factor BamC [Rhodocyclaceae bacterium]|nr:outer membrane protein assembly factor BamC [Rhodocyclaceae bacterium]